MCTTWKTLPANDYSTAANERSCSVPANYLHCTRTHHLTAWPTMDIRREGGTMVTWTHTHTQAHCLIGMIYPVFKHLLPGNTPIMPSAGQ